VVNLGFVCSIDRVGFSRVSRKLLDHSQIAVFTVLSFGHTSFGNAVG